MFQHSSNSSIGTIFIPIFHCMFFSSQKKISVVNYFFPIAETDSEIDRRVVVLVSHSLRRNAFLPTRPMPKQNPAQQPLCLNMRKFGPC